MRGRLRALLTLAAVVALPATASAAPARLDPSFGVGGVVRAQLGSWGGFADVTVRPDGRLLAAGGALPRDGNSSSAVVQQYTPRGALDRSFGRSGTATLSLAAYTEPHRVLLLPDGRVVVVGVVMRYRDRADVFLARFSPQGRLDPTYGTAGAVAEDAGTMRVVTDAALLPDGQVVVVGQSSSGTAFVERYTAAGRLDGSFGIGGTFSWAGPTQQGAVLTALSVQPDGRLVLAGGEAGASGGGCAVLLRLLPQGLPDPVFGTAGRASSCATTTARALVTDPQGRLVTLGTGTGRGTQALTRWTATGTPDPTFGAQGTRGLTLPGTPLRMLQDRTGRFVLVGFRQSGRVVDGLVARVDTQGRPDPTFGPGGVTVLHLSGYTLALGAVVSPTSITVAGLDGTGLGRTAGLLLRLTA